MREPKQKVWEATCLICGEVISNPLCPGCLAEEMEDLLGREHPESQLVVRGAKEDFATTGEELISCILCGKEMNVCPYCFMEEMRDLLTESDPRSGEKLSERFGYGDME
jgi:hypothetical protein